MAKKRTARRQPKAECFVIMPISDHPDYVGGHFRRVYEDLIKPACNKAKYAPVRADDVRSNNLIHADILHRLIHAPMAICDLSSRNPNVLFELGIRQAFDRPVVLIQDEKTDRIFDINILRIHGYRSSLLYHQVIDDQKLITDAFAETAADLETGFGVNSIIKLLSIQPANLDTSGDSVEGMLQLILAELNNLKVQRGAASTQRRVSAASRIARRLKQTAKSEELSRAEDLIEIARSANSGSFEGRHSMLDRAESMIQANDDPSQNSFAAELTERIRHLRNQLLDDELAG